MSVSHSARSGSIIGISFRFFFNKKVCFVFSLESPYQGDSNEDTQHTCTIIYIKKEITNTIMSGAMGFFVRDSRTSSKQPW